MSTATPAAPYRYGDFLTANRGGNLFTFHVNQRIGAAFALAGYRLGLAPTILTLANLVFSVGAAAAIVVTADAAARGETPWWPVAVLAAVAWQIAYSLDCADGQLARTTGQKSPAGARVDILCDVVSQTAFVAAIVAVVVAYHSQVPAWFLGGFCALWMVNLVTSILQTGESAGSIVASRNIVVELVKCIRDTGVIVLAAPLLLIIAPQWMLWFLVFFTATNGLFLLASIAFTARDALRS